MTTYCIANWKMTGSLDMIHEYIPVFLRNYDNLDTAETTVILCPPHPYLGFTVSKCAGYSIAVGAQDVSSATKPANTSEVSAEMLTDLNVSHVIIGHSEYRQNHNPSPDMLAKKLINALALDMTPIFCIGESEADYDAKKTKSVLESQLSILSSVAEHMTDMSRLLIAYEPVWAIGTGKVPSYDEIENICDWIAEHVSSLTNCIAPVLYGGSVKANNAEKIMSLDAVQGVLVGGASLDPESFAEICNAATKSD